MLKCILNTSHAVPEEMITDFILWQKNKLNGLSTEHPDIDHFIISEVAQQTNDQERVIVSQIFFNENGDLEKCQYLMQALVQDVHQSFQQRILAFGSIMNIL